MVARSNEHLLTQGAQFSISMPNDLSVQGFLMWPDWHHVGHIPLHLKIADGSLMLKPKLGRVVAGLLGWGGRPLFRRRADLANDESLEVQQASSMPDELDEVFDAFARDCGKLMIRRTAAYWNWRYMTRPDSAYRTLIARHSGRLTGAVVTSVRERGGLSIGMVVDLVTRRGIPGLRQLLQSAEKELLSRRIGVITCQATSPMLQTALRQEGYRHLQDRWVPKQFNFIYRISGVPGFSRQPRRLADWHLTFGDSDNV